MTHQTRMTASDFSPELLELYDFYAHGIITKRQFLDRAGKLALGGLTAATVLGMMSPDYALAEQVSFNDPEIRAEWITYPSPNGHGEIRAGLHPMIRRHGRHTHQDQQARHPSSNSPMTHHASSQIKHTPGGAPEPGGPYRPSGRSSRTATTGRLSTAESVGAQAVPNAIPRREPPETPHTLRPLRPPAPPRAARHAPASRPA